MKKISIFLIMLITAGGAGAQKASESVNRFGFDLYQALSRTSTENIVFSPFSISNAFGMVTLGARDETLSQLNSTFHFEKGLTFHKSLGNIQNRVQKSTSDSVVASITNRVWIEQSYSVLRKYKRGLKKGYGATIHKADFINAPDASRLSINQVIETDTRGYIKNLLPEGSINKLTRLVLTNAIFFKGKWSQPFNPKKTSERYFTNLAGNKLKHPFMSAEQTFGFYRGSNYSALEMDYKGNKLSMIIVLPNDTTPFLEFEKNFSYTQYHELIGKIEPQKTLVFIPKFTIETDFAMKKMLQAMGLIAPFNDSADFSGISGYSNLKISDAYHKAFIEVSEEGTTAAAATAVVIAMKSMPNFNVFDANRPFIYILRHKPTNTILFIGRFVSPAGVNQ